MENRDQSSGAALLAELRMRGLVCETSGDVELSSLLDRNCAGFYVGFDPTSASLHAGSLVPLALMRMLQRAGHRPYCLIGGATGLIGDPSGKSESRLEIDQEQISANSAAIEGQLRALLSFGDSGSGAVMIDNSRWLGDLSLLDFLVKVGRHLRIGYMVGKESVRGRLGQGDRGISFAEFSYMCLQAYDFHVMAELHGCRIQAGGSDQWGNITAGIDLHRRMGGRDQLFGITAPLLLDSEGKKMGKTARGTRIWLDRNRTSPYAFYQSWLNIADNEVGRLLFLLSTRRPAEIRELVEDHQRHPEKRGAQRVLAADVTEWVHGEAAKEAARKASEIVFGLSMEGARDRDLCALTGDLPSSWIPRADLAKGIDLDILLLDSELVRSKAEARRLISAGGVYLNNVRVADPKKKVGLGDLGTETMIILRTGKKKHHVLRMRDNQSDQVLS